MRFVESFTKFFDYLTNYTKCKMEKSSLMGFPLPATMLVDDMMRKCNKNGKHFMIKNEGMTNERSDAKK